MDDCTVKYEFADVDLFHVACVVRVEQRLKDLKGVQKASVNFATEKATVEEASGAYLLPQVIIADKWFYAYRGFK
ncbi:MAG: heavy metal-associated domain-containing protein [Thermodesulfobacteriota bacterium]|nr:heavy metal-associated domain-containing protein [Thermodesulfobacteriota bacterium]